MAAVGLRQLGLWAGWSWLRSGPWLAEGLPGQRQSRLPSLRGAGSWHAEARGQRAQGLSQGAAGRNMPCGGGLR